MKRKTKTIIKNTKEMMYQTVVGDYNAKHNCVFTDEGKSINVSENTPVDSVSGYCAPAGDKDRVEIVVTSYDKDKPSGYISKVIARFTAFNVGVVEARNGNFYLNPFGATFGGDILINPSFLNGAIDGSIVTFLVNGKDRYGKYEVFVQSIIGHKSDNNAFVKGVTKKYGFPTDYSPAALKQAASTPQFVSDKDRTGRVDKRNLLTITIDGDDTKDRDDAVRLTISEDGYYMVGVDIADVDYYVPLDSPIDLEARRRGNSCYAGGQCNAMIDKRLSNGICSVNEGVDRLTMSATTKVDKGGVIRGCVVEESVINVNYNMTYDEVDKIYLDDPEMCEKYAEVVPMIKDMFKCAEALEKRFKKYGYLEFSSKEAKIKVDIKGQLEGIDVREATPATKLIQFFMITANIGTASLLANASFPCVFRVHDTPDERKIDELCEILNELGYYADAATIENYNAFFQNVISQISGRDDEDYIMSLLKRTQRKAKYSNINIGHFAIAWWIYCHFTSPIRRYSDLCVARALKAMLHKDNNTREILESSFEKIAMLCSKNEIKADTIEREVLKILKCIDIKNHIGETFEGRISNMARNGFFVELENTTEGYVYIGGTNSVIYNESKMTLLDKKTNHNYRLGEKVKVEVVNANEFLQIIDFKLA